MKNAMDMVRSAIKELTKQVARDRKWKRSMDERLEKALDLQESWQTKEREKTTESLQMAMNSREAKKKRKPRKKMRATRKMRNRMHTDSEPMGELWFWELCYHRCG
jgi:hypothetical protein